MKKARIIGKPIEKRAYPLIEIMGQVDTGKRHIAEAVAKQLDAELFVFPNLSTQSFTGFALLTSFSKKIQSLERNPKWWIHLYMANICEQLHKISKSLESGPVVVLNYVLASRVWMSAVGLDTSNGTSAFFMGLPQPNIAYNIIGRELDSEIETRYNFSTSLRTRVNNGMSRTIDNRIIKVRTKGYIGLQTSTIINRVSKMISDDVGTRYSIKTKEFSYPSKYFYKNGEKK